MQTFRERLEYIQKDRGLTPWLQALGSDTGMADRINKGSVPTEELLSTICAVENVSLTWLLEGRGRPFIVNLFISDEEAADHLETLLKDEDWSCYLLASGQNDFAVVLRQPGQRVIRKKSRSVAVNYDILEVIAGRLSIRTLNVLHGRSPGKALARITVTAQYMQRLAAGDVGSYELVGMKNSKFKSSGVLDTGTALSQEEYTDLILAEESATYVADEAKVMAYFRDMSTEQRETFKAIAKTLVESRNKNR